MPYVSEKIKLPRELDRRVKLTEEQRQEIREKWESGLTSKHKLAEEYKVSRRTIQMILDPELKERLYEASKRRHSDGRYAYSKEEWAAVQREHRAYKQKLYVEGLLKEKEVQ